MGAAAGVAAEAAEVLGLEKFKMDDDGDDDRLSLVGWWTPFKKGVLALLERLLESLLSRLLLLAEAGLALGSGDNHDGELEDSLWGAVGETWVVLVKEDNVEINPEGRFEDNVGLVVGGRGCNGEVRESVLSSLYEKESHESRRGVRLEEHGGPATWSVVRKQL